MTGAITSYIDVAQLVLYAFWIFFAGLIFYLRREGYPLEADLPDRYKSLPGPQLLPLIPEPKTFLLAHGGTATAPNSKLDRRKILAERVAIWPGAPLQPTGDPMRDAVGPAAYVEREEEPERTLDGEPMIVPLRVASDHFIEPRDPDPRGMEVLARTASSPASSGTSGSTAPSRRSAISRSSCRHRPPARMRATVRPARSPRSERRGCSCRSASRASTAGSAGSGCARSLRRSSRTCRA